MDPETAIKAEVRLFVLESLVALLCAAQHQQMPDAAASFEAMRGQLVSLAKKQTFGSLGAVYSDLASAELEEAVDAALALQKGWLGL